ncbi:transcription factor ILI7-like [Typha angustifolia]|uniref:transcription factor ILI7-like n=1 Tax=Typha angustifolia TaxID=59011 RepID=UPI003C2E1791
MPSRRSQSSLPSSSSRITQEQIADLLSKLQQLLPESRVGSNERVSSATVLQETCNYIKSLHRDIDDLSARLGELLAAAGGVSSEEAAMIRSLLM